MTMESQDTSAESPQGRGRDEMVEAVCEILRDRGYIDLTAEDARAVTAVIWPLAMEEAGRKADDKGAQWRIQAAAARAENDNDTADALGSRAFAARIIAAAIRTAGEGE